VEPAALIENFEKMLAAGKDNALLRFGLGNAYLSRGQPEKAVEHLTRATELDPGHSASWKQLGKAQAQAGRNDGAIRAYRRGIEAARAKGDKQAEKEMTVFLKRLEKQNPGQD